MSRKLESKMLVIALFVAFLMVLSAIPVWSMGGGRSNVAGTVEDSNGNILFQDNFDDGTLDKWRINKWNPDGTMEATDAVSHSPNYSAHAQSDPNTNTAPNIAAQFNETHNLSVEGYFYLPQKSQEFEGFRLFDILYIKGGFDGWGNDSNCFNRMNIGLRDDNYNIDVWKHISNKEGNIIYAQNIYELQPETWYKTDIQISGTNYSVYINDNLIFQENVDINTSYPFNILILGDIGGSGGCWGDAYWDDITIRDISPTSEDADVSISDSDISFSDTSPEAGSNLTISATIHGDYDVWDSRNSSVLFSDNFDDGTFNKWFIGRWNPDGVMEVTGNLSHSPDYCAHSQSDPDTNTAPFIARDFKDTNHVLVEDWVYLPKRTQDVERMSLLEIRSLINGLNDPPDPPYSVVANRTTYAIKAYLYDNNYTLAIFEKEKSPEVNSRWAYDVYSFQPETWYKLGIEIDGINYQILINGNPIYNGTRYDDRPVNMTGMGDFGGSSGCWGDVYFDDVAVTDYSPHQTHVHKAQNSTCTVSFYLDDVSPENLIYKEDDVFVPANGEVTVNAPWSAVKGEHSIIVKVENVNPDDRDLSNNIAERTVSVGSSDVDLSVSDISFSDNSPKAGDNMTISATIHGDHDIWDNSTESEILFSDNFDDGTFDKWYVSDWIPSGVMEVTDRLSHSPDYCAHSQSDPNTNTGPHIQGTFNFSNNFNAEVWVYLPEKSQEYQDFRLLELRNMSGPHNPSYEMGAVLDDNFNIDMLDNFSYVGNDLFTLSSNTWYRLDLNVEGKEYVLSVNGNEIYRGTRITDEKMNKLIFGDTGGKSGCGGDAYMDDATITEQREIQNLSHKAQNATCTVSFYLDEVSENNLIYREDDVPVPANGEVTVNAPWSAVEGNHTIIVQVENVNPEDRDYSNNSASVTISVSGHPDLSISPEDISYYDEDGCGCVCMWDTVNISAEVHNIGRADAEATVSFYIDDVDDSNMIYREYDVYVPAGGSKTVYYEWTAYMDWFDIQGNHTIIVVVSDSNPAESNLDNNMASKDMEVDGPQHNLMVKVSTDSEFYIKGIDDEAGIAVKVLSDGYKVGNASLTVWVTDPEGNNVSVPVSEEFFGIYTGTYSFGDDAPAGEYVVHARAEKDGYGPGESDDSFFVKAGWGFEDPVSALHISEPSSKVRSGNGGISTIELSMYSGYHASSVSLVVRGLRSSQHIALPLYDDGTHGDSSAGDSVFTGRMDTSWLSGIYVVDVVVDGMVFDSMDAFYAGGGYTPSMEIITDMDMPEGPSINPVSDTGVSVDMQLAHPVSDGRLIIIREAGKLQIVPSSNIDVSLVNADIRMAYTSEDVPDGVDEHDMRLYTFNRYTGQWQVCQTGWVESGGNIFAETDSFGEFSVRQAPYTYSSQAVHEGWNALTLPWATEPMSIEDALYSVEWDRAMVYVNGQWYTYNKERDAKFNAGFPLVDNTMGIYVHVISGDTLKGSYNAPITSTVIHLNKGWNLIGFPSGSDMKVSSALAGLDWKYLEGLDASGNTYHMGASDYMISGNAYWVYVEEPCDISIEW